MTKLSTGGLGSLIEGSSAEKRRSANRRRGRKPQEERTCKICGGPFTCAVTATKLTCNFACAERYHAQQQAARMQRKKHAQAAAETVAAAFQAGGEEPAADLCGSPDSPEGPPPDGGWVGEGEVVEKNPITPGLPVSTETPKDSKP